MNKPVDVFKMNKSIQFIHKGREKKKCKEEQIKIERLNHNHSNNHIKCK